MNMLVGTDTAAEALERVVVHGDLGKLTPEMRVRYYREVCDSVGLNPLTKPFEYITLNNKLTLYARRDATDQLRRLRGVSIKIAGREKLDSVYVVTAQATDKSGRCDEAIGAVNIEHLKGENLANAIMKAETKAKRRVTLSICGLGVFDESEIEDIQEEAPPPKVEAPEGVTKIKAELQQKLRHLYAEFDAPATMEDFDLLMGTPDMKAALKEVRDLYAKHPAYWADWSANLEDYIAQRRRDLAKPEGTEDAPVSPEYADWIKEFRTRINNADLTRLDAIGEELRGADMFPEDKQSLRKAWAERKRLVSQKEAA